MKQRLLILLLFLAVFVFFFVILVNSSLRIIVLSGPTHDGRWQIADIAYYLIVTKAFWLDNIRNIYSIERLQQAQLVAGGFNTNSAMPLAISPSFILLLFPLIVVYSFFGLNIAQIVWVSWSLTILFAALFIIAKNQSVPATRLGLLLFIGICLINQTFLTVGLLGQTTFFAAGCLLFYFILHQQNKVSDFALFVLVFCLSIKISYLAYLMIAIFTLETTKKFLLACVFALLSFFSLSGMLNRNWIFDFLESLSIFTSDKIPIHFQDAFDFSKMNIFRSAFLDIFQTATTNISSAIMLSIFVLVFAYIAAQKFYFRKTPSFNEGVALFTIFVGAHLLFSPYIGAYEDFLILVLGTLYFFSNNRNIVSINFLLLIGLSPIIFNFTLLYESVERPLLWGCKALLILNIAIATLSTARGVEARK